MAKTEIILTHNVVGLGAESDQIKVAAGYARNYLFPQGLAIPVTGANKRRLEALRQRRAEREAHDLQTMTSLAQTLSRLTLTIKMKTGDDGKLFGSVTAGTIADELKTHYDATVDKRKIHLAHPIKVLGDHEVELRLHHDVTTKLKVKVESTTPIAAPVETSVTPAGARPEVKGRSLSPKAESGKETSEAKATRSPTKGRPDRERRSEPGRGPSEVRATERGRKS